MRILEEFWYGNIEPTEYDTSASKEYKKLLELICRNEEKLKAIYGFKIDKVDDEVCIRLDGRVGNNASIQKYFAAWQKQAEKYRNGEISKEEYDRWRYNYPKFDTESGWVKVPSQELSDAMVEAFKDHLKDK